MSSIKLLDQLSIYQKTILSTLAKISIDIKYAWKRIYYTVSAAQGLTLI